MSSFRDQLKATSTKVLKKIVEEEDMSLPSGGGNGEYLKLDVGLNKIRIYPKHPGEEKYSHIKSSCWLGVEGDDGKDVRRTFQNARVHLKTANDIVEEYINKAKAKLSTSKDSEDLKKLKDMTEYKQGSNASIGYGTTWIVYADKHVKNKEPQFGLLELKKSVRDALNKETIIEDEDEAMEMDPFTDPDEGKPILITYDNKAKKAADYYKVQVSKNPIALTEEQTERFEKCKPLSKLPNVNYTLSDFEKVLEGLRNYDDTYEIGIFEEDDFQEMIEKCREQVIDALSGNEEDETKSSPKKSSTKSKPELPAKKSATKKKVEEEEDDDPEKEEQEAEETPDGDEFDSMDREELKRYNRDKVYGISVIKNKTTDDDLREAIREKEAELNKSSKRGKAKVEEEDPEEEDDNDVEEVVKPSKPRVSLTDLKKKLNNK